MKISVSIVFFTFLISPVNSQEMSWLEATDRFERERGKAVSCTRIIKNYSLYEHTDNLIETKMIYNSAKTEMDASISLLKTALIIKDEQAGLEKLSSNLRNVTFFRKQLCKTAYSLIPSELNDERGRRDVAAALTTLSNNLPEIGLQIWKEIRRGDELRRNSLLAHLEDMRWPPFEEL